MARPRKAARLELRGRIHYIIDGGLKLSTQTDDPEKARVALDQYLMGKAAAPPLVPQAPLIRDLLRAYGDSKLEERREKVDASTYADIRRRLVSSGTPAAEAHARAAEQAAREAASTEAAGTMVFVLKHLERHLGNLPTPKITEAVVRMYAKERRAEGVSSASSKEIVRRVSNSTIARELTILRAAVNWADKAERRRAWFGDAPKPEFGMPASDGRARQRFLTKGEAARLLAACHLHHVRLFVRIALATGARKEAIETLRWSQVDFERNTIDFGWVAHRKKRPLIQMTRELRAELLAAKAVSTSQWVVERNGARAGNVKKSVANAIAVAGLKSADENETVTAHVFKHTFVSWLLHGGRSFEAIAKIVNTSPRTLERHYGHWDVSRADEIGEAVALDAHLKELATWSVPELAGEIDQPGEEDDFSVD